MRRVAVVGNAGGGKSTLARALSASRGIPYFEVDALQWNPDWSARDPRAYDSAHDEILERESWVLDGLGGWASVERRLSAADTVILIDLPLWAHFWLAAERQIAWHLEPPGAERPDKPAGHPAPPPTRDLFEMIWRLDRDTLPQLRTLADEAEAAGSSVIRLQTLDEQEAFLSGPA